MKTFSEVAEWCAGAAEELGDPAEAVCQVFARWCDDLYAYHGDDISCGWTADGELALRLFGPDSPPLPLRVETGEYQVDADGRLVSFGAVQITAGVWEITPSLNAEGLIHAFLVLYDVPTPAPWEKRIVPAGASR